MPFVPVPNTAEVELRMTLDSQRIENTLYFFNAAGPDPTSMNLLAAELETWWINEAAPLLPADVALREIVVTDLTAANSFQITRGITPPEPGTLGQPALPNNVTLAVSFRTAIRGRGYRGRNYVPALTEGQVVNNTVAGATVTDWATAYASILTDPGIAGAGWVWVVASRYLGVDSNGKPIPRVVGNAEPITSVVVTDATVDSQRRRLPGRGQ